MAPTACSYETPVFQGMLCCLSDSDTQHITILLGEDLHVRIKWSNTRNFSQYFLDKPGMPL